LVPGFLAWSLSRAPSARAVRAGIKDYLTRRFGKVADDFRDQLASDEKTYDKQLETRTS
jgi:hypothetical protein